MKAPIAKRSRCHYEEENPSSAAAPTLPDDLLASEIFPRLLDHRTAVRCRLVSRRWRSLLSTPAFIHSFIRRRQPSPSYALFIELRFHSNDHRVQHDLNPLHLTVSPGGDVGTRLWGPTLHHVTGAHVLKSACDDVMLFSTPAAALYLRNVVTNQSLPLPHAPQSGSCGALLVSQPHCIKYNFRVVLVDCSGGAYYYSTFSSETGRWSGPPALAPRLDETADVVAMNGLLFWLESRRLVILDAFKEQDSCTNVSLPADLHDSRLHIGAVRLRLRLAQVFRATGSNDFVLKIWELNDSNDEWRLVRELKPRSPLKSLIQFFSFDADDEDAVFLCFGRRVYRHSITSGVSVGAGFELSSWRSGIAKPSPRIAHAVSVRTPLWPTSLPVLLSPLSV